jgi:rfaE bifunctional protein nucleotidyltransferase chain/domain
VTNLDSVLTQLRRLKKRGKTVVFTNGCFDLIHAGHVHLLKQAKSLGDLLVVGLNSDDSVRKLKGGGRPVLKIKERVFILQNLKSVDFVIPFNEKTPARLIQRIQPDILIKGGDWKKKDIVGCRTVLKNGGEVVSGPYVKGRSTTQIIQKIHEAK